MQKLNSIRYMRAVSACMIVFSHFSMLFPEGFIKNFGRSFTVGIYVFFILSGFSIAYFHKDDPLGLKSFLLFIKKRLLRILPMYWVYSVLYLAADDVLHGMILTHHDKSAVNLIRSFLLFPAGIVSDYQSNIIPPAWFLSYVVFFYVIWGILRYTVGFHWAGRIWGILILINVCGGGYIESSIGKFLLSTNFLAVCIGTELSNIAVKPQLIEKIISIKWIQTVSCCSFLLLMMITALNYNLKYESIFQIFYIAVIAIYCLWEISADLSGRVNIKRTKIHGLLVYLDAASYTVFLLHYLFIIVFFGICSRGLWQKYLVFIFGYPVIVTVCCLAYLIETKIKKILFRVET